jgi:hypothetical protein
MMDHDGSDGSYEVVCDRCGAREPLDANVWWHLLDLRDVCPRCWASFERWWDSEQDKVGPS